MNKRGLSFDTCPECGSTAMGRAAGETRCNQCGAQWRGEVQTVPPQGIALRTKMELEQLQDIVRRLQENHEQKLEYSIPVQSQALVESSAMDAKARRQQSDCGQREQDKSPKSETRAGRKPNIQVKRRREIVQDFIKSKLDFANLAKRQELCQLLEEEGIPLPARGHGGANERPMTWANIAQNPKHAVFSTLMRDRYPRNAGQ